MIVTKQFESSSSSAVYTASFDPSTGKGTCNCPGWTKRAVRECKHTKSLAAESTRAAADAMFAGPEPAAPAVSTAKPSTTDGPGYKPMLASAMKEGRGVDDYTDGGWALEEKFDGHRMLVVRRGSSVEAWSRPGADRPAARRELPAALAAELAALPEGVYDGELIVPGGTSSDVVRLDRASKLKLVLFDALRVLDADVTALPLSDRRAALALAHKHCAGALVLLAEQTEVNAATIKGIWARGGEGAILKRLDAAYQPGKRSADWVKVKSIGAAELTIVGFEAGKSGPRSVFSLRHDDGRTTSVKVLTDALLRAVHADPDRYLGRRVTISFMGLTPGGQWRHPILDHFVDGKEL